MKYIDKGVIYVPIESQEDVEKIIANYKSTGKTVVTFKSGKQNMKDILINIIKTRLNA